MVSPAIKQILVPTDLSTFSIAAMKYAELFRERLGASATVMYANEPLYPMTDFDASLGILWNAPGIHDKLERELHDYVHRSVHEPDSYDVRIVDGLAPETVLGPGTSR